MNPSWKWCRMLVWHSTFLLKTWTTKTTERSPLTWQSYQKSYELTNGLRCKRLFDMYLSHLDFFDESKFKIPVYPWNHGTRPLPCDSDVMMTWPLKCICLYRGLLRNFIETQVSVVWSDVIYSWIIRLIQSLPMFFRDTSQFQCKDWLVTVVLTTAYCWMLIKDTVVV